MRARLAHAIPVSSSFTLVSPVSAALPPHTSFCSSLLSAPPLFSRSSTTPACPLCLSLSLSISPRPRSPICEWRRYIHTYKSNDAHTCTYVHRGQCRAFSNFCHEPNVRNVNSRVTAERMAAHVCVELSRLSREEDGLCEKIRVRRDAVAVGRDHVRANSLHVEYRNRHLMRDISTQANVQFDAFYIEAKCSLHPYRNVNFFIDKEI